MNRIKIALLIALVLTAGLVTACGPMAAAFSPEEAALKAATMHPGRDDTIDDASIKILQSSKFQKSVMVLITYSGVNQSPSGLFNMTCLNLYKMSKNGLGLWVPDNSGGGCSGVLAGSTEPAEPQDPVTVQGGMSTGPERNDPGTSTVYGQVFDTGVKSVRVTWKDGSNQNAEVINGSYIAVRTGQLEVALVEGLNEAGEAIYSKAVNQGAPGKQ